MWRFGQRSAPYIHRPATTNALCWSTFREYPGIGTTPGTPTGAKATAESALIDIAKGVQANGGALPLSRLIHSVAPATKQLIMKSGKGLEGYVKFAFPKYLKIGTHNSEKVVRILDEAAGELEKKIADDAANVSAAGLADEPSAALRKRIVECMPNDSTYYSLHDMHIRLYKSGQVPFTDFERFVMSCPQHFWVQRGYACQRLPNQHAAPPFDSGKAVGTPKPSQHDNFGGFGSAANVPTSEDVYEILKYVPIHWAQFGDLNVPPAVRQKHIRQRSSLNWYSRLQRYFELRMIGGTLEIRRAVVLHPDAHGMSKEDAEAYVEKRIQEDREAGEPIVLKLSREVPGGASKAQLKSSLGAAGQLASPGGNSPSQPMSSSPADNIAKIVMRICPGYFIPSEQIMRRSTKKITEDDIVGSVSRCSGTIEMVNIESKNNNRSTVFFRKKTGVDESKWMARFLHDIQNTQNIMLLRSIMARTCAQWDRTHFVYVRLPDEDKAAVGGFDGMIAFMKAHPSVFAVGEYFCKRLDQSDPNLDQDVEPTATSVTTTKQIEENPYHLQKELALVFHYLTPENDSATLAHFVECSSPAMRSVLPPRLITILQAFPDMFDCKEVSPGSFTVSRQSIPAMKEKVPTAAELCNEVLTMIPIRGIEVNKLESMLTPVQKAALMKYFPTDQLMGLINTHTAKFLVVKNPPYTTVFVKK